jgi:hypothetical protein
MRNSTLANLGVRALVAASLAAAPVAASAQFAGPYGPGQAIIATSNGGSIDTSGAPATITLVGGDDFSGVQSDQTYAFTLAASGNLSFDWSYLQNDCCGPLFDPFGYTVNGVFTQLTNDGGADSQSGSENLSLVAGDIFAFDQRSLDNEFGFATTTISNFSAPTGVPEPATWAMMLLGFGAIGYSMRRNRRVSSAASLPA